MTKKRYEIDSSLVIVIIVALAAIIILSSNFDGNFVGGRLAQARTDIDWSVSETENIKKSLEVQPACTCDGYYHTGHWLFPNEQNCYGNWWNPGEPEQPCISWMGESNGPMYSAEWICNDICAADGYNEGWTGTCAQCNGGGIGGFVDTNNLDAGGMAECLCGCSCGDVEEWDFNDR